MADCPWRDRPKSERLRLDNGHSVGRTKFESAVALVDKTGAADELEARLVRTPKLRERLPIRAFLTAIILHTRQPGHRAQLTDIVRILNALTLRQRNYLGMARWRQTGAYDVVFRLAQSVEQFLDCDELDIDWIADALVMASIDSTALKRIGVAVDSTAIETSAVLRRSRADIDELMKMARGLDATDVYELLHTPTGRRRYTADPHATIGRRSATGKTPASLFVGFDWHLAVSTRGVLSTDGHSTARLTDKPPALVLMSRLVPANSPQAGAVAEGVFALASILDVTQLAMDAAYSKNKSFLLECKRRGLDTAFKPTKHQRGRHQLRDGVDTIDGMPFSSLTPIGLVPYGSRGNDVPGPELGDINAWRYSVHQYNKDGTMRLMDPFKGGRLRCAMFEVSMRNSLDVPLVYVAPEAAKQYRPGTVTVGADELPFMQLTVPGSIAHEALYGTRNQVENVNGQLRSFTDLGPKYHPSFSLPRRRLFHAALVAGHNQRELDRWIHEQSLRAHNLDEEAGGHHDRKRRSDAGRGWEDHDRDSGRPFGYSESGLDPPSR